MKQKTLLTQTLRRKKLKLLCKIKNFFRRATNLPSLKKLSRSYFVKIIQTLTDQNHKVSAESFLFEATADKYLYFKLDESVVIYLFSSFQEPNFSSYKWQGFKI